MYIYDALYGKIEFPTKIWRCIFTPEVQRLREVRLCNINSLCITGSANTNRFEHSIGTSFLAQYNIKCNRERYSEYNNDLDNFVLAALLHDVANGPFGHSYEYLKEKQGFIPEKGLKDVFSGILEYGQGATGYSSPYENIFFGKPRLLTEILGDKEKNIISDIIAGKHFFSKLLVNEIDIDNIDNVFRMAYHMGIPFPSEAPLVLAKSMYLENDQVVFKNEALPYLEIWHETRKRIYKFLLLNPQEFAGKYMLTEAMDIAFLDKFQNASAWEVKWYFTDYELLDKLYKQTELWIKRRDILKKSIGIEKLGDLHSLSQDKQKEEIKRFIESIELTTPIKEKGKKGNSNWIKLSDSYKYKLSETSSKISIHDRNMDFEISNNSLYKIIRVKYNPSQIVSRLVCGDLYDCLMIIKSKEIDKYKSFLDYESRLVIENELESIIRSDKLFHSLNIGIHPILDKNKTERKLHVMFEGAQEYTEIGNSSKDLLLGIFIKNEPYGLKQGKIPLKNSREKLIEYVVEYLSSILKDGFETINLYDEVNEYGCKRY